MDSEQIVGHSRNLAVALTADIGADAGKFSGK
jgi:hypothetical protein